MGGGSVLTLPSTESKPLRERLLPQTSIRFFMFLIAVSAVAMYTFRAALVTGQFWAKIGSLLITTAGGCFIVYAALFFVANLFSATTVPILDALDPSPAPDESHGNDPTGET